jgi:hypothetical protein
LIFFHLLVLVHKRRVELMLLVCWGQQTCSAAVQSNGVEVDADAAVCILTACVGNGDGHFFSPKQRGQPIT